VTVRTAVVTVRTAVVIVVTVRTAVVTVVTVRTAVVTVVTVRTAVVTVRTAVVTVRTAFVAVVITATCPKITRQSSLSCIATSDNDQCHVQHVQTVVAKIQIFCFEHCRNYISYIIDITLEWCI
jgi:hypothetical protein